MILTEATRCQQLKAKLCPMATALQRRAVILGPEPNSPQQEIFLASMNPKTIDLQDEAWVEALRCWIRHSLQSRKNILATSNQGTILLFRGDGEDLIIKTAMGKGLVRKVREKTLLREYAAYQRLHGVAGVPACYGLLDGRHLLIEYVEGALFREATWHNRDQWFEDLLGVLLAIHARGVSHADLKSKGNLLVTRDEAPCVVDFGTAFVRKPGFHPLNHWLFETGKRLDLNAWVKHKYHGYYNQASPADRKLLDYTWLEVLVRRISGRSMDRVDEDRR